MSLKEKVEFLGDERRGDNYISERYLREAVKELCKLRWSNGKFIKCQCCELPTRLTTEEGLCHQCNYDKIFGVWEE